MKKKTEKAYFNELWDQMTDNLNGFFETGDQEKLHHFRVQVKKLRALLVLLDMTLVKSKLSKEFKPVKKIFKHGGKIREAYINLQLGSHYELKNDDFILNQVNHMEKEMTDFRHNAKKYLKTIKAVHDELQGDLKTIDDEKVNEFYKNQLEQIALALKEIQFNDDLHNCRKKIKILMYNLKIADKALSNLQLDKNYLDKLQDRIGDWHDTIVAIQLFSAPEINDKLVITRIKRQSSKLKKSIKDMAGDFWKKATATNQVLSASI